MTVNDHAFFDTVLPPRRSDRSEDVAAAKRLLQDSIAVVLGTLDHEVAVMSRRVVDEPGQDAVVWGVTGRRSLRAAVRANGAALRCYDFNDLYIGDSGQGGHPSDALPALVAVADRYGRSGAALVEAITIAYDDIVALMDVVNVGAAGFDYANLVGLGAVRALAYLLGLDEKARRRASAIFAASHIGTNELESGALGADGNLTSWKRFNASTAVLGAVDSCLLAAAGVDGPIDSLTGRCGFLRLQGVDPAAAVDAAAGRTASTGVRMALTKRWPVGSRAQSGLLAAVAVHEQLAGVPITDVAQVAIESHPEVIAHLVRPESFDPESRETADHSLPYIVSVALASGNATFGDFDDPAAWQRDDVRHLLARTQVTAVDDARGGVAAGHPTRVTVTTTGGDKITELRALTPDELRADAMAPAIAQKWDQFARARLGDELAGRAHDAITRLDELPTVRDLTSVLDPAAR